MTQLCEVQPIQTAHIPFNYGTLTVLLYAYNNLHSQVIYHSHIREQHFTYLSYEQLK